MHGPDSGVHLLRMVGDVEVWSQDDLLATGHPGAQDAGPWLCLPVEVVSGVQVPWLMAEQMKGTGALAGLPVCVTWQQVLEAAAGHLSGVRCTGVCRSSEAPGG